jgi:hypothetical protein
VWKVEVLPLLDSRVVPEGIELLIEDQASSPSYDLAPPPPSSPLSRQQVVFLFFGLSVCHQSSLLTSKSWGGGGGEEGVEEEPIKMMARKPGLL